MAEDQDNQLMKTGDDGAVRRVPQQRRSRRKVEKILETAMALIQESGIDSVSMRKIARESGLPIATVYQYFPNKQAIVRMIWESYTSSVVDLLKTELEALLDDVSSENVQKAFDHIVDSIADSHERNPAFVEIRRCVEATPDLRQLNFEDTMQVAGLIRRIIMEVNPQADEAEVANYTIIATEAASSTVRVGQQMPSARRRELYASLKSFLLQVFRQLSRFDD